MTLFNDPTSCNDLKLTLVIMAILILSAFTWLFERGTTLENEAIRWQENIDQLTVEKEQHQSSFDSTVQILNKKHQTLISLNKKTNQSLNLSQKILLQNTQDFNEKKEQLIHKIKLLERLRLEDIATINVLKTESIEYKTSITQFTQNQTNNDLKIAETEKSLKESREISKQQYIEYQNLRRDFALVKFETDTRNNEINEWQLEVAKLKQQLSDTQIEINASKNRFTIFEMKQDILFDKGQFNLKSEGQKTLARLAKILRQFPNRKIAIQGHSDAQKLGPKLKQRYTSNWELAAARAASAIHFLQHEESINPKRIMLVSYSHFKPKQKGVTAENFAANRRIEIILLPKDSGFLNHGTE